MVSGLVTDLPMRCAEVIESEDISYIKAERVVADGGPSRIENFYRLTLISAVIYPSKTS